MPRTIHQPAASKPAASKAVKPSIPATPPNDKSSADNVAPDKILQTGLAFWQSKTLLTAVEMRLFRTLAKGPMSLDALRGALKLHERGARDFFDALVALGFLQRDDGRDGVSLYRNTPETDRFLDPDKPSYVGGILEMCSTRLYPFWDHLGDALRTGEHQNEARHGTGNFFTSIYADPKRLEVFLRAMSGVSRGANLAIAQQFPWQNYKTFADVGTAQGDLALQIAKAHPHLKGIGFDLPAVKPIFDRYVAKHGCGDRLKFATGDFFKDAMPRADVILMGHILHDWDLPTKRSLLAKAYAALPEGGAVVIYDSMIDDDRRTNAFGLLMSLNMLIETPGGFDYTGADCCDWLKEAGFKQTRVEHLTGPDSMAVGIK